MTTLTVPHLALESSPLREQIRHATFRDIPVDQLRASYPLNKEQDLQARTDAARYIEIVRRSKSISADTLMQQYNLTKEEGVSLLCLAEALLRIPDNATRESLINDKLGGDRDWSALDATGVLANCATFGLLLVGRAIDLGANEAAGAFKKLVSHLGTKSARNALQMAMRFLGNQFVLGETIEKALSRGRRDDPDLLHSFDMLGEAALTWDDSTVYFDRYMQAIAAIGEHAAPLPEDGPGISIKLTAIEPRLEIFQFDRVKKRFQERLLQLAEAAAAKNIGLCIDAEEAHRLEIQLDSLSFLCQTLPNREWSGLGLAVQAYQKRSGDVVQWCADLAKTTGRRLMVRLVKGAYWDWEVKYAQEAGIEGFPVFTRKPMTDMNFLNSAKALFDASPHLYPCIATHNGGTAAQVAQIAGDRPFEFQRLFGMGEALHDALKKDGFRSRIYAPVGGHNHLLPYLVRRLLENGANSSFVNRARDQEINVNELAAPPVDQLNDSDASDHPAIQKAPAMYTDRTNSPGLALEDPIEIRHVLQQMRDVRWDVGNGQVVGHSPADTTDIVSRVSYLPESECQSRVDQLQQSRMDWSHAPAHERSTILLAAADLLVKRRATFLTVMAKEGGKTLIDAVSEHREAVDFLRYYASLAQTLAVPTTLPGPTGELNELSIAPRGVFACISPWNFPLAIFLGQVAAALSVGNAVIAKPAEETPLTAVLAIQLLHDAGVPKEALALALGDGRQGAALCASKSVSGVVFTGSSEVAQAIGRSLAARNGAILPFIAETGGLNFMIADSSALYEQVTRDAITGAFRSAGQRCSATRILAIQEDVASELIPMIQGAMEELTVGHPLDIATDVGPMISGDAASAMDAHLDSIASLGGSVLSQTTLPSGLPDGHYRPPTLVSLPTPTALKREVFAPVLHIVTFKRNDLPQLLHHINDLGYGLTLSLHTRIKATMRLVRAVCRTGNVYVNRNQIGAVVGTQPFGGEGLSGTGPKAGGPHYLHRFCTERTYTENLTASGGNPTLLALDDDG